MSRVQMDFFWWEERGKWIVGTLFMSSVSTSKGMWFSDNRQSEKQSHKRSVEINGRWNSNNLSLLLLSLSCGVTEYCNSDQQSPGINKRSQRR